MPQKNLKSRSSEMRFPVLKTHAVLKISVAVVVVRICFFFILNVILFSLMKTKKTAVRCPTGGSRPLATGFY